MSLIRWQGILCFVDQPSCRPPCGARHHRVKLTIGAALMMRDKVIGAHLLKKHTEGHNRHTESSPLIFGKILESEIIDGALVVSGTCEALALAEVMASNGEALSLSFEITDCYVSDMRAEVWEVRRFRNFFGAAVCKVNTTAFAGNFQVLEAA